MTSFNDTTHMERQLSSLFRAEAQNAHLPPGTWQAIAPRMGEPDEPSLIWRLKSAAHVPWRWRNPLRVNAKYAAPAATILLAAIAALLFILLVNDEAEPNESPIPAVSPTVPVGTPTLAPTFTPLPATATAVPEATATAAPTTAPQPEPMPTATMMPTAVVEPTATSEPAGSFSEVVRVGALSNEGTWWLADAGDDLFVRSTSTNTIWRLDSEMERSGSYSASAGGTSMLQGPVYSNGKTWSVSVPLSELVVADAEDLSFEIIPLESVFTPRDQNDRIVAVNENGVWVRLSGTEMALLDATGAIDRTIPVLENWSRPRGSGAHIFFEDGASNSVIQVDAQGEIVREIAVGTGFVLLGVSSTHVFTRPTGGFVLRAPTVTGTEINGTGTVEFTIPINQNSRYANYLLVVDDEIWVAYETLTGQTGNGGDLVRFHDNGTVIEVIEVSAGPLELWNGSIVVAQPRGGLVVIVPQ